MSVTLYFLSKIQYWYSYALHILWIFFIFCGKHKTCLYLLKYLILQSHLYQFVPLYAEVMIIYVIFICQHVIFFIFYTVLFINESYKMILFKLFTMEISQCHKAHTRLYCCVTKRTVSMKKINLHLFWSVIFISFGTLNHSYTNQSKSGPLSVIILH